MPISHVLVVVNQTTESEMQDILEVLEALPISDSTRITVTDNASGVTTFYQEISESIGEDLSPRLGNRRLNS